jgi:SOS response associated peptidase (SRAP)
VEAMCNRFRSIHEWSQIPRQLYNGPRVNFEFNPNVAPTETVPVLIAGNGVVLARFGVHRNGPNGKPRPSLLNARTDGMRRGQFRRHLKKQRCVIPADGFYEWRDEGGKQPYYFDRKDRSLPAFREPLPKQWAGFPAAEVLQAESSRAAAPAARLPEVPVLDEQKFVLADLVTACLV